MPSDNASDQAKARLAALEADPKQQHPDPKAIEETLHGALDDAQHQGKPDLDPHWHQDANGNWTHPGFEGGD